MKKSNLFLGLLLFSVVAVAFVSPNTNEENFFSEYTFVWDTPVDAVVSSSGGVELPPTFFRKIVAMDCRGDGACAAEIGGTVRTDDHHLSKVVFGNGKVRNFD
ncbi:MAG: hypothetical protein AB8H47_00510 [Bacteroidia bacterium]